MKIQDVTVINVYEPPPAPLTTASLPGVNHPCIYAGDFNCHHTEWGCSESNGDGTCLVEWASADSLTLLCNPGGLVASTLPAGTLVRTRTWLLLAALGIGRLPHVMCWSGFQGAGVDHHLSLQCRLWLPPQVSQ